MKKITLSEILSCDVVTVALDAALREVLATLSARRISCVVAVDDERRPLGIFTEQDAVRLLAGRKPVGSLRMADAMSEPPLCTTPAMDIRDAYQLLQEHLVRHLMLVDARGQLAGIATESDFLRHLDLDDLADFKTVSEVMARDVATADAQSPLSEVAAIMHRRRCSSVVVLRDGVPTGIITERDAVQLAQDVADPGMVTAGSVMRAPLLTIPPDTPLPEAIQQMDSGLVRHLVVRENGDLLGIVTRQSLIKTLQAHYVEFLQSTIREQRSKLFQLKQQQILFKLHDAALSSTATAISITDRNAVIEWANPAFARLTGYELEEIVGHTPGELVKSGAQTDEFYRILWQTILSGQSWHGEMINRRKDGTLYTKEATITPVSADGDGHTHFICVEGDVSAHKQQEQVQTARGELLDAILARRPLPDVMLAVVRHIERIFPEVRASVLLFDEQSGTLGQCIAPSLPDYYAAALEGVPPGAGICPCDIAAHTGEATIIEDLYSQAPCDQYRELAVCAGVRACVALPFRETDGTILGILTLYFSVARPPHPQELALAGEFARILGIAVGRHNSDLARQAALQQVSESDRTYRGLFDSLTEAVYIIDQTGNFIDVNRGAEKMYGYARAEFIGKSAYFTGAPDKNDMAAVAEALKRAFAGIPQHFEYWGVRKNGEVFPKSVSLVSGEYFGQAVVIAIARDITERKQSEARLREAAAVMDSTHEGVLITDAAGAILAVNRAFSEVTGYSAAEVIGKNPSLLKSGHQDAAFYRGMWDEIKQRGYWQGEVWNRRKNGEFYPELLTISAIYDDHHQPLRYIGVFADITQLKKDQAQIEYMAHHDALTRLPNRTLVESRLRREIENAQRHAHRLAVLFIDLDRFKLVNDSFGHLVGDELLCAVAERLTKRVRDGDTLGRLGGDEFILLVTPLDEIQDAAVIARDFITALSEPFLLSNGIEVYIGGSIGISMFPGDGDTPAELMKNADAAMYLAKENGRNQFSFYTSELNAGARDRLAMENDLRHAVLQNELHLHYQPKVDLRSGQICGAEALARWRMADGNWIPPSRFIPIAEKSGLILSMGEWVIEQACRQMRAWLDQGIPATGIAVNVSARQFRSGNLDRLVAQMLAQYRIEARYLELELTESMLMQDPEQAIVTMQKLKQIGVKLSLDDFGTGYSSFNYLSRFPIDTLKIDQSFVRDVVTEPDAAEIASAIIALAHRLKLRAVAEGVENAAQLAWLGRNGCHEIQGYHFSKPLPPEEFAALLSSGKSLPRSDEETVEVRTLLIVDDEPEELAKLAQSLRCENYRILTAGSAADGLSLLALHRVQVILADQHMAKMNGPELLRRAREIHPDTVRILLSDSHDDLAALSQAVNSGIAYKFLTRPITEQHLRQHILDAFTCHTAALHPIPRL